MYTKLLSMFCREQLVKAIIKSGQAMASAENSDDPLKFSWHDKVYLGAAHGYAGIFFTLMQVNHQNK